MSKALIQLVNSGNQTVDEGGIIGLGTTTHRFGNELAQSGNGVTVVGDGYYEIKINAVIVPAATGDVTITLLNNGVAIPGATATGAVGTVGDSVTLPIDFIIRRGCHCSNANNISVELTANSGTISNIVTIVEKK